MDNYQRPQRSSSEPRTPTITTTANNINPTMDIFEDVLVDIPLSKHIPSVLTSTDLIVKQIDLESLYKSKLKKNQEKSFSRKQKQQNSRSNSKTKQYDEQQQQQNVMEIQQASSLNRLKLCTRRKHGRNLGKKRLTLSGKEKTLSRQQRATIINDLNTSQMLPPLTTQQPPISPIKFIITNQPQPPKILTTTTTTTTNIVIVPQKDSFTKNEIRLNKINNLTSSGLPKTLVRAIKHFLNTLPP
uniref:Uncharacterized protein LOC113796168 n=1 Tax=Dermatophagoides pteronyssinus TaxID=6956 RepID=A0A6P6YA92_DERPT|nr:uncharacterized protein LOC113796168 [Dermatophagoides pteronyssinus]